MLTFNGKPFDSGDFERALQLRAVKLVVAQVRERFATIRHPETGEFPVLFSVGDTLEELTIRLEASAELIEIVKQQTHGEELNVELVATGGTPRVFLSYAFDDQELAGRIAHALQAQGIDTWWAGWCIAAGDSLRQKIDQGLTGCTHFVVLLTRNSIDKPWVKQEMDAGLVKTLKAQATFIPLRHRLGPGELPPLLSGVLSPEVNEQADDIQQLINDIHGITKKPPLGPPPAAAQKPMTSSRYSRAALAVAEVFVRGSAHALALDPQVQVDDLRSKTGLSADDVTDALHELGALVEQRFHGSTWPRAAFFTELDEYFMPWTPASDALRLAADMVNNPDFPASPADIAQLYGWPPRRLNPAIAWLVARDLVRTREGLGMVPWGCYSIERTDGTRRFLKGRATGGPTT